MAISQIEGERDEGLEFGGVGAEMDEEGITPIG
jgi:hypothetical protein